MVVMACRQALDAAPVRIMGIDNLLERSERHMTATEVAERRERKQTWQAIAEEAARSWKAMFSRPKRQREEEARPRNRGQNWGNHIMVSKHQKARMLSA